MQNLIFSVAKDKAFDAMKVHRSGYIIWEHSEVGYVINRSHEALLTSYWFLHLNQFRSMTHSKTRKCNKESLSCVGILKMGPLRSLKCNK